MSNDVADLNALITSSYTNPAAAVPQPTLSGNLSFVSPTPFYNVVPVFEAPVDSNTVGTTNPAPTDTSALGVLTDIGKRISDIGVKYLDNVVAAKTSASSVQNHNAPGAALPQNQGVAWGTVALFALGIGAVVWLAKE